MRLIVQFEIITGNQFNDETFAQLKNKLWAKQDKVTTAITENKEDILSNIDIMVKP